MRTLSQAKFEHLGYMWGPNADPRSISWLQFADDTAIIANDVKKCPNLDQLECRLVQVGRNEFKELRSNT